MTIKERLQTRRLQLHLSIKDVANALGVPEDTAALMESENIKRFSIDKIVDFAKVLHFEPFYFMGLLEGATIDKENLYSSLSNAEINLIEKYRLLDKFGLEMVDFTLEKHYERCCLDIEK